MTRAILLLTTLLVLAPPLSAQVPLNSIRLDIRRLRDALVFFDLGDLQLS
jgi:hypothetical protein